MEITLDIKLDERLHVFECSLFCVHNEWAMKQDISSPLLTALYSPTMRTASQEQLVREFYDYIRREFIKNGRPLD